MSARETHTCPECGQQSYVYWFTLTPGLVGALVKLKRAVIDKGENSVHTRKDMDGTPNELTKNEYGNFTRLRFHGLVAKDDDAGRGYWLLTKRGNAFLKGQESVPRRVQTLNNKVIGHDEVWVTIEEVMGSTPYFEDIETTEREAVPIELAQGSLPL